MRQSFTHKTNLIFSLILFLLVFAVLASLYTRHSENQNERQFRAHAEIITLNLWALNASGIESYLKLAAKVDHYQDFRVLIEEGKEFLAVSAPPPTGLEGLLRSLHLIGLKKHSKNIVYEGQRIGILEGTRYIRVIFPLANIFLVLLLLSLTLMFIRYLVSTRNILEKQVDERTREYRESERRYHKLVNLLPEMVWEADKQGRLTYLNDIGRKCFGITEADAPAASCFDLIAPGLREQAQNLFAASLEGENKGLIESTAINGDGREFPVLVRCVPRYVGGQVAGTLGIIIDISERHALEEQLRRAQKMEAMGLMAGGVAHDLNNILSGVINYPEIILDGLTKDSHLRTYAESMRKSGLRAAEVVADLLTVARGVAAARSNADPNQLIKDTLYSPEFLQLRSLYPAINSTCALDEKALPIRCSPTHVRKCLMNLISNAAEAIQGKGEIVIRSSNRLVEDAAPNQLLKAGWYSVIAIEDNGGGISPRDMDRIFEPFYTKKVMGRSGTGLGLAIVWNTMQDHNGEVRVHSSAGSTTFELLFPSIPDAVPVPETESAAAPPMNGSGEHILVIDDDEQQREIAEVLLASLGYAVHSIASGEEAVSWIENSHTDLLLLDMLMPPGMGGRETYEQILRKRPGQKAVLVSGYSENEDVKAALELGAGAFIQKPYTLEHLGRVVSAELRR